MDLLLFRIDVFSATTLYMVRFALDFISSAMVGSGAAKDEYAGEGDERRGLSSPRASRGDDRSGTGGAGSQSYHSGGRSADAAGGSLHEVVPIMASTLISNVFPSVCRSSVSHASAHEASLRHFANHCTMVSTILCIVYTFYASMGHPGRNNSLDGRASQDSCL